MHQQHPGVIHPESQKTKASYRQGLGLSEAHCIKTLGSAFHPIRHLYARAVSTHTERLSLVEYRPCRAGKAFASNIRTLNVEVCAVEII